MKKVALSFLMVCFGLILGIVPSASAIIPIFLHRKTSEFFEKSPLSRAKKHSDFQVTSCHQNVSTNVDFAYIKSE